MRYILFSLSAIILSLFATASSVSAAVKSSGFVYVMTNQSSGNAVVQFSRNDSGALTELQQVSTGGLGSGGSIDPLTSEDSLVGSGSFLLAVNAGSDEVSTLGVSPSGLALLSKTSSGGDFPNSIAVSGDLVYVLNAHGSPNITAFRLNTATGALQMISNSTRTLPGGGSAAPHDVRFSPDGSRLLVTDGGTNQIDVYEIAANGLATFAGSQHSPGSGPFGFRFGRDSILAVTEAATASVSSYQLTASDTLNVISAAVPDGQAASCWISIVGNGHAFVSNTGSGTISSYQLASDGSLTLANSVAAATGSGSAPIDSAPTSDGQFLYVVDSALGRLLAFRVQGTTLAPAGIVTGLPTSIQGISAQ